MIKDLFNEIVEAITNDQTPKGNEFEEATRKSEHCIYIFGDRNSGYRENLPPDQRLARIYADYKDGSYFPFVCGEERKKKFIQFLNESMI